MKKITSVLGLTSLACLLSGCAAAPGLVVSKFFDVQTNLVARVRAVTNVVPVYVTNLTTVMQTNWVAGVPAVALVTNATVEKSWVTNLAVATNLSETYIFRPNTNAAAVSNVVGRSVGVFGGAFGQLAGVLAGGLFGLWGYLRSARAARVAGVLAQVIETGRMVLQSTPQGQALDEQWKHWMVKHQGETGVIQDVVGLLGAVVDNTTAKAVANQLVRLIDERKSHVGTTANA
ncbi:MAG TPA: hypothetical protein VN673_14580 [Clostridia bacterium]|nr:hypothetical protein [Clostridia bacterium]